MIGSFLLLRYKAVTDAVRHNRRGMLSVTTFVVRHRMTKRFCPFCSVNGDWLPSGARVKNGVIPNDSRIKNISDCLLVTS